MFPYSGTCTSRGRETVAFRRTRRDSGVWSGGVHERGESHNRVSEHGWADSRYRDHPHRRTSGYVVLVEGVQKGRERQGVVAYAGYEATEPNRTSARVQGIV